MVCRKLSAALLAWLCCVTAQAAPLPEAGRNVHEGVASCASGVCHGKVSPDPDSPVQLNEYRTWLRNDFHSRAYKTLLNNQSKAIAAKLGLPSANAAKICLDCHADNVDASSRGRRFQISDGVSCEACHGGSGQWLESHAEQQTSHADNLAQGMYPTEQPIDRARLCLSCHLGTRDKFATHRIMGAGHPRLAFDLEVFTENQPRHYKMDEDYRERKPAIASVNMWLAGLLVSSMQTMELLQEAWFTRQSLTPELSFFQCHACHHPMDKLRWQPEGGGAALPPGAVRLNDGSLVVLQSVLQILSHKMAGELESAINALHTASMTDRASVVAQAAKLHQSLSSLESTLVNSRYSSAQITALRSGLVKRAAAGRFRHFTSAEQAFLAVETLNIALGDNNRLEKQMDGWFATVADENDFVPLKFAVFAKKLAGGL
jgi:hypothetical protein